MLLFTVTDDSKKFVELVFSRNIFKYHIYSNRVHPMEKKWNERTNKLLVLQYGTWRGFGWWDNQSRILNFCHPYKISDSVWQNVTVNKCRVGKNMQLSSWKKYAIYFPPKTGSTSLREGAPFYCGPFFLLFNLSSVDNWTIGIVFTLVRVYYTGITFSSLADMPS